LLIKLYHLLLSLIGPGLGLLLGLLPKFSLTSSERNGFGDWKQLEAGANERTIWIHAASVGEVAGVKPLLLKLRAANPQCRFLVSTTSETGKEAARKLTPYVALFPFDYPQAVSRVIKRVRPELVVLAETELWPVFLNELKRREIPLAIVNARISDYSWPRYKMLKGMLSPLLSRASLVAAQTEKDQERFISLGCPEESVTVSGSTKYDNLSGAGPGKEQVVKKFGFSSNDLVFVAGSVRPGEDEQVVKAFKKAKEKCQSLKIIIAPRHPEEFGSVAELLEREAISYRKRSDGEGKLDTEALLLDSMGELSTAYSAGDISFVGATLVDIGGHNPMEPAALGLPVLMGPYHSNVREEVQLLEKAGGLFVVQDSAELSQKLLNLSLDKVLLTEASKAAKTGWKDASGAVEIVLPLFKDLVKPAPEADYNLKPGLFIPAFLKFLSCFFFLGTGTRNTLFNLGLLRQEKAEIPVVSVGNVTVGGSGKTPVTAFLCAMIREQGLRPVIVTRGYKGKLDGPHLVGRHDKVEDVGDEALMQCRKYDPDVKVVVAKKRVEGAAFVKENDLGDVVILDDGFQHRWLKRDLNILLVDPSEPDFFERWSKPRLLPAGRFREEPKSAFKRADLVLFVVREWKMDRESFEQSVTLVRERFQADSIGFVQLSAGDAISIDGEQELALSEFRQASVVTALAQPGQFSDMLESKGVKVVKRAFFPDHFSWTEHGWRELSTQLIEPVLVTEKDATKLCRFNMVQEEDIWVVPLQVRMFGKETPRVIEEAMSQILSELKGPAPEKERVTAS